MVHENVRLADGRTLAIRSLSADDTGVGESFVALLPVAGSSHERLLSVARDLLARDCIQVCCVGPGAEEVHDLIDESIESDGAIDVVTTWHEDVSEGIECFLCGAGAGQRPLVALVAEQQDLVLALRSAASQNE